MNDGSIVWILGAGFSRSLGGPLLEDLLVDWRLRQARNVLAGCDQYAPEARLIELLVGKMPHILGTPEDRRVGRRPWRDAEELLSYFDLAPMHGPTESAIWATMGLSEDEQQEIEWNPRAMRAAMRFIVAASCTTFLDGRRDLHLECWDPYGRWIQDVRPHDTIVTFNYDDVLETLMAPQSQCDFSRKAQVLGPDTTGQWVHSSAKAMVLKLHGSADWALSNDGTCRQQTLQTSLERAATVAIATPGLEKKNQSKSSFGELWEPARRSISQADAVVFLGYRFPPSDAYSKQEILNALARSGRQRLSVHTLSDDTQ